MNRIWRTIRGYVLWTHDRGSVHYDVMVTLILAFIFLTPRDLFKDKPVERTPHQTEIVVLPGGDRGGFIYQVAASAVGGSDDAAIRSSLERIIEPIAGEVTVTDFQVVRDGKGRAIAYKAWVRRP